MLSAECPYNIKETEHEPDFRGSEAPLSSAREVCGLHYYVNEVLGNL